MGNTLRKLIDSFNVMKPRELALPIDNTSHEVSQLQIRTDMPNIPEAFLANGPAYNQHMYTNLAEYV